MASTRHDRNAPSKNTQPKTYKLTLKAIISFPYRMCNPPPAVGKVRSCGVTPLLKVRLQDVLNREHLPPLGLKDFEEWLLFVEMTPENLYFILWLREYKLRYSQWKSQTAFTNKNAPSDFPINPSTQYSSHLAMFYARAKQTFLTPGSEYELNLTSTLLAPFQTKSTLPPHPPPELFREVELETYRTLDESLRRFVHGQLNNVGTTRVMCGIVAGIIMCLAGAMAPLAWSFATGTSRAMRLSALPGLWLGLTILFASLNGICLGVYVFGDLRQLRKFELARPPISKPTPLPFSLKRFEIGAGVSDGASARQSASPARSVDTRTSDEFSFGTASTDDNIHISPAYYDDGVDPMDDLWGPAQPAVEVEPSPNHPDYPSNTANDIPALATHAKDTASFTSTASFIHPFDSQACFDSGNDNVTAFVDRLNGDNSLSPSRLQPLSAFDFDALPRHPRPKAHHQSPPHGPFPPDTGSPFSQEAVDIFDTMPTPPPPVADPTSSRRGFFKRYIQRQQEKCSFERWQLQIGYLEPSNSGQIRSTGRSSSPLPPHPSSPYWQQRPRAKSSLSGAESTSASATASDGTTIATKEKHIMERFRKMASVPAFAVPLTRVLSPVVVRAQWEIVVRSAVAALFATWVVFGIVVAVPVTSRGHATA
ncbi:hypothetical protein D9619_007247 [Psilocybe cf. subviscida]|uniref:RGS domain-containing protein n=1 Tax=Psilocybe cf. subviscida TaxID=2480587 RepID=A0A8H5B1M1_9AGAR|nr:hypothetical protein D9619_007247 [Psilocybe cf. subviscida]